MPQDFLSALGQAVGGAVSRGLLSTSNAVGGASDALRRPLSAELMNASNAVGTATDLAQRGAQQDLLALSQAIGDRSASERRDFAYHTGYEGLRNPNPLVKLRGAAGLGLSGVGVGSEVLAKPVQVLTMLAGMGMNGVKRAAGDQAANPLSFAQGEQAWQTVPAPLRIPLEVVASRRVGGAVGENTASNMGKLFGAQDSGIVQALSRAEAAPGQVMGSAVGGAVRGLQAGAQRLGIGVPLSTSLARQSVDEMRQEAELAASRLREAGHDVDPHDVLEQFHLRDQGDPGAAQQVDEWDTALNAHLGGQGNGPLSGFADSAINPDLLTAGGKWLIGKRNQVQQELSHAQQTLADLNSRLGTTYPHPQALLGDRNAVARAAAQHGPLVDTLAAYAQRFGKLAPQDVDVLSEAEKRAVGDLAQSMPTSWLEQATDGAQKAPVLGGVLQGADWINQHYRPLALLSPRFHLNNLTDQAFKSGVGEGIQAWMKDSTLARALDSWGQLSDPAKANQLASQGLLGRLSADGSTLIRAPKVVSDGFGQNMSLAYQRVPVLRTLEAKNKYLTQWIEQSARLSAYVQGKQAYLLRNVEPFAQAVGTAAGPDAQRAVLQSQGMLSPSSVGFLVGNVPQRRQLMSQWANLLRQGDKAGADLSTKIHFNYRYGNNLDPLLGNLMLFHIFSTRNLLYYPQLLAQNPGVTAALLAYAHQSEQQRKATGMTPKAVGTEAEDSGLAGQVANRLFGPNAELLVNPLSYLSIAQQAIPVAKQVINPDPNSTLLGSAVEGLDNTGLSLTPPAQLALHVANKATDGQLLGDTDPLYSLIPQSGAVSAVASAVTGQPQDVEGPIKQVLGIDDPRADLIRRRVQEMAVEAGRPGAYNNDVANPNSPIYQQAAEQVAHAQALKSLVGFGTGLQVNPVSGGERAIRQAQVGEPPQTIRMTLSDREATVHARQAEMLRDIAADPDTQFRRFAAETQEFPTFLRMNHVDPSGRGMSSIEKLSWLLRYAEDQRRKYGNVLARPQLDSEGYDLPKPKPAPKSTKGAAR